MADYSITRDQQRFKEQLSIHEQVGNYYVSLLGLQAYDTVDLIKVIQDGLSYSAYERFAQNSSLPKEQLLALVQLPLRTLQRRKREGALHADESDRLMRAARVFGKAVALFEGDYESARNWFSEPLPYLGNVSPLELAASELGAREVETLMDRLEQGISV